VVLKGPAEGFLWNEEFTESHPQKEVPGGVFEEIVQTPLGNCSINNNNN
jgi:hypothetical protein